MALIKLKRTGTIHLLRYIPLKHNDIFKCDAERGDRPRWQGDRLSGIRECRCSMLKIYSATYLAVTVLHFYDILKMKRFCYILREAIYRDQPRNMQMLLEHGVNIDDEPFELKPGRTA